MSVFRHQTDHGAIRCRPKSRSPTWRAARWSSPTSPTSSASEPTPGSPNEATWSWSARPAAVDRTVLATAALALAAVRPADELHVYVLDLGSGTLDALTGLPQCGAVVRAGDEERCRRLLRWLGGERRRRLGAPRGEPGPAIVVAVDGLGALAALANEPGGHELLDVFSALVADGASIGIHLAVSAERVAAVSPALSAAAGERWLLAGAEHEGGPTRSNRRFLPGRAVDGAGRDVQIVSAAPITESVRRLVSSTTAPAGGPTRSAPCPPRSTSPTSRHRRSTGVSRT